MIKVHALALLFDSKAGFYHLISLEPILLFAFKDKGLCLKVRLFNCWTPLRFLWFVNTFQAPNLSASLFEELHPQFYPYSPMSAFVQRNRAISTFQSSSIFFPDHPEWFAQRTAWRSLPCLRFSGKSLGFRTQSLSSTVAPNLLESGCFHCSNRLLEGC